MEIGMPEKRIIEIEPLFEPVPGPEIPELEPAEEQPVFEPA